MKFQWDVEKKRHHDDGKKMPKDCVETLSRAQTRE